MQSEFKDLKRVTELRGLVDGFAAKHAALNVSRGADKKPLLAAYQALAEAAQAYQASGEAAQQENSQEMVQRDKAVHIEIVELSGIYGLRPVWQMISGYMTDYNFQTLAHCWPDLDVIVGAHADIVDAIARGDADESEKLAKMHLDSAWYRMDHQQDRDALPDDPVAIATAYLAFHFHEQVTLNFLAKYVAKISVSHLSRLFKSRYGVDFTTHLKNLRLKKAASLLREEDTPINEVALQVGYKDPSRFAEQFREKFSVNPLVYRKQHKEMK